MVERFVDRFVAQHPQCRVGWPSFGFAASVCGGAALAVLTGVVVGVRGMAGEPAAAVIGAALVAVGIVAGRGFIHRLSDALELKRRGHGCYAIADDELLLVDTEGNSVVLSLDAIESLELADGDVRMRVDPEVQGVVYAILFDLFEQDGLGPNVDRFFETLAPALRERGAAIHDDAEPALQ